MTNRNKSLYKNQYNGLYDSLDKGLYKRLLLILMVLLGSISTLTAATPADSVERVAGKVEDVRLSPVGAPTVSMKRHVREFRRAGVYYIDSVERKMEETPDTNRNWWHLLQKGKLSLSDTTVRWPRFLGFCMKVYNWGDRFFNGFDTTYVVGTGRRWKVRLVTDLWADSYALSFSRRSPILMTSRPIVHTGLYLQYMAVSFGYQLDVGNVLFNQPTNNRRMNFGFSCGLFSAEGTYAENSGGTYLHRFADYNDGHKINEYFPGQTMRSFEANIFFFLNHRKYSQVAAYSFGRYQKKRAGSMLLGFSYMSQNVGMDFSTLPEAFQSQLPPEYTSLHFNFYNYNLLIGYGYSWPVKKHLLFNVTALPAIGFNVSNVKQEEKLKGLDMLSFGMRAQVSVTYNLNDFFAGVNGKMTGQLYSNRGNSLFSMIESATITMGVRF